MAQNTIVRWYVGLETADENLEIHPEEVMEFIDNHDGIEGATLYESKGYWRGNFENSIVIESVNPECSHEEVKTELEEEFNQDSVMTMELKGNVMF